MKRFFVAGKQVSEEEFAAHQRRGLGDRIERALKPIAKALRLNCLDSAGNLKPDSGCARRRERLNKLVPRLPRF